MEINKSMTCLVLVIISKQSSRGKRSSFFPSPLSHTSCCNKVRKKIWTSTWWWRWIAFIWHQEMWRPSWERVSSEELSPYLILIRPVWDPWQCTQFLFCSANARVPNLCVSQYVSMCVFMCVCMHTLASTSVCGFLHLCGCACLALYLCASVCASVCVCVCLDYVCVGVNQTAWFASRKDWSK